MKNIPLTLILFILFISPVEAQKRWRKQSKTKHSAVKLDLKKNSGSQKIISAGVVNGRALSLPRPPHPLGARTINVQGTVGVSVLIDEEGNVIEAKALTGHPLLKPNSVAAALLAKFEPVLLGGIPVKVSGIITYKYSLGKFNWLEIGRAMNSNSFVEMLPSGFDDERQMFEQYQTSEEDSKNLIIESICSSIENKLIDQRKALWLFQAGRLYNRLENDWRYDDNFREGIAELKISLLNAPENISPALISKLDNMVRLSENSQLNNRDPEERERIYRQFREINEMLPMLGN